MESQGGIRWAQAAVTRNPNNLTPRSLARAQPQPHDTLKQTSFSLLIQNGAPTSTCLLLSNTFGDGMTTWPGEGHFVNAHSVSQAP